MSILNDHSIMPFGKYKGVKMCNVPASYLHYIYYNFEKNYNNRPVFDYITNNIDVIETEVKREKMNSRREFKSRY